MVDVATLVIIDDDDDDDDDNDEEEDEMGDDGLKAVDNENTFSSN